MSPTISASKKSAKSSGRQTNNSLSSLSGQIHIEHSASSTLKSNDSNIKQQSNNNNASSGKANESKKLTKVSNNSNNNSNSKTNNNAKTEKKNARNSTTAPQKASSSSVLTETEEVLQIGMHKVLEHVKNHKDAWPFMDPVEEDIAPRYYSIIRRPMDLQQMDERLESGQYLTFTDFRNDFKLIVNNCRLYNGQNNEYTEMVNNLQHAFEKATKKYFDQNSSDEDGDLEYPDLKTNVFREKSNSAKNTITPKIKEIIGSKGLPSKSPKKVNDSKTDENTEKPTEKRGRKRKQKFKDKRKTAASNSHNDDDEVVEEEDGEDQDEEEVVPAKRSKKEKVKETRETKEFKKSKEKKMMDKNKTSKDSSATVTRRKSSRKEEEPIDDDKSDVELEPIVKKKKTKHVIEPSPEKGKPKTGHANKKELKKSKSNKKRKSSEAEAMDLSDVDDVLDADADAEEREMEVAAAEKIDRFSDQKKEKTVKEKKAEKKNNNKMSQTKSKQIESKKLSNKKKTKQGNKGKQKIVARDESRSRSPSVSSNASSMSNSPMRFIDLHEKYSKSASNTSINKIDSVELKNNRARSPSPSPSIYSSENSNSVKDKFDLIKERRSRSSNNEDKWKQIVMNAEKIKDKTSASSIATDGSKVQEKNQKLKETIEKLKQKNKQSKKLLNKLSDAKSSTSIGKTDEKSPFDLLRESKPPKAKTKSKDAATSTIGAVANAELETSLTSDGDNKKSPNKKPKEKPVKGHKKGKHTNKTANMEALELETEQTLKDINRWLEHTPRFPEFNSASNSPTRFSLLYDFDTVTSKLDPADFRRPLPITNDSTPSATTSFTSATDQQKSNNNASTTSTNIITTTKPSPAKSSIDDNALTTKENKPAPKQTIQLTGIPPPPGPHKRDKEPKRKTLKEKISGMIPKRKDIHRTIERMQPGKTKGNLIGTIHSAVNKQEDVSILGTSNSNKLKDTKNSLVQETDDSGPKLSLGTVLNTAGFGLIQQHNFSDNVNTKDDDLLCDSVSKDACSDDMELEEIVTSTEQMAREKERKEKEEKEKSEKSQSPGDKSATPNLNAWLKAFGVPKKQKKSEEEDVKKSDKMFKESSHNSDSQNANSPTVSNEQSMLTPATRTRKASTGSTSSYSQDPDSPRIGIDERICGSYPAPYPSPLGASPLGASPIMTSPKDETPSQTKPTSPYSSMNGSMRVGFYQDTTTKSSPEKSCSPREQPSASPYSNYAQHLYVSTTTSGSSNSYGNVSYTSPVKVNPNQALLGFNKKQPSYFDQYKQPKSQDSDYNSSVGSNPASPYQSQHSPYQSENSPYQQSQTSPYAQQPNSIQSNVSSPYQNQQSPYQDTSMQQQHSPYNQTNASQDVHAQQHLTSLPKTSPQTIQPVSTPQHISSPMNIVSPTQQQQPQPQQQQQQQQSLENKTISNSIQYGLQAYSSHYPNLVDPPAPSVINSSSSLHDKPKPDDEQRDILNLDYAKQTSAANKTSLSSKPTDLSHVDPSSKVPQQHGYEHSMFEPMGFNKNYDISSTKAIEMFNRAATMSFSKSFPTPLSTSGNKAENPTSSGLLNTYQPPSMHSNYSLYSLDNKSATHIGYNPHENDVQSNQTQSMHHQSDKHLSDPTNRHGLYGSDHPSISTTSIPNDNRMKSSDLNVPTIPHRYDVPTYDPNMRIHHPLVDDNLNGGNCYYPPKDPSVAQSIYGKNVLPPSSQSPTNLNHPYKLPTVAAQPQPVETKPKRTRKKKNAEPTPVAVQAQSIPSSQPQAPVINNNQMVQQHNLSWNTIDTNNSHPNVPNQIPQQQTQTHQTLLNQQHPQHPLQAPPTQGFQSYAGLKPPGQTSLVKNTSTPEATPISLKTNSIVPGSAFNFGPTSSGSLALSGIYGENTPYLDEYRASANPYYLPPQTHRSTAQSEQTTDNTGIPSAAGSPASYVTASRGATSPAPTYHQFLPHHPYTNSQIYQQYLRTEEYRQRMMFANPSLLPHSAPTGYPQPSYHPALGMHKPYGW